MAILLLSFAILAYHPREPLACDRVDMLETNHFYDTHARLIFTQAIFWQWDAAAEHFQVVAWRMMKHRSQTPLYNHATRLWIVTWLDGTVLRRVSAPVFRATWTQYDPEQFERSILPVDQRRGFTMPIPREVRCVSKPVS